MAAPRTNQSPETLYGSQDDTLTPFLDTGPAHLVRAFFHYPISGSQTPAWEPATASSASPCLAQSGGRASKTVRSQAEPGNEKPLTRSARAASEGNRIGLLNRAFNATTTELEKIVPSLAVRSSAAVCIIVHFPVGTGKPPAARIWRFFLVPKVGCHSVASQQSEIARPDCIHPARRRIRRLSAPSLAIGRHGGRSARRQRSVSDEGHSWPFFAAF